MAPVEVSEAVTPTVVDLWKVDLMTNNVMDNVWAESRRTHFEEFLRAHRYWKWLKL